jgi:hypothetical protein
MFFLSYQNILCFSLATNTDIRDIYERILLEIRETLSADQPWSSHSTKLKVKPYNTTHAQTCSRTCLYTHRKISLRQVSFMPSLRRYRDTKSVVLIPHTLHLPSVLKLHRQDGEQNGACVAALTSYSLLPSTCLVDRNTFQGTVCSGDLYEVRGLISGTHKTTV